MLNDKVIKTAFLISFLGHCLFLGIPAVNLGLFQAERPEDITVRIEIERPPLLPKIDVMGEEKKIKELAEVPKQSEPEAEPQDKPQPEEVVIEEPPQEPLQEKVELADSVQEAMLRYQDMVKQRIEEMRRYPYWAMRRGVEGTVYMSFTVLANGLSRDIKIARSSGHAVLDNEAAATIKRANPFPPIPKEISNSSVGMEVSIVFKLR